MRARWIGIAGAVVGFGMVLAGQPAQTGAQVLAEHRNLGKAFYENPTTQQQAVDQFKQALDLAPDSARERVNYGLALLRAGKTDEGIAELERAQKQDPSIPHTWFNLGIAFKKAGEYDKAVIEFEQMVKLVPDEPVSRYNLGYLYRLTGRSNDALVQFEEAERLDPNLAGPHFQLYNAYRALGRTADAAREEQTFRDIKAKQTGAAVPEDLDWSYYAEILDPIDPSNAGGLDGPLTTPRFEDRVVASGIDSKTAGLAALDVDGDGRTDLVVWSSSGVQLLKNGATPLAEPALAALRDVVDVAPGDYDNDGASDLAVVTRTGAAIYRNERGRFVPTSVTMPAGSFVRAVWLDVDRDYDLDLLLVGEHSAFMRNNGQAGFSDQTTEFPFVSGRPLDAVVFEGIPDTPGQDLAVSYADRPGVIYRDRLAGKYEAVTEAGIVAGTTEVRAADLDHDGAFDLLAGGPSGLVALFNRRDHFDRMDLGGRGAFAVLDLENRGTADLVVGQSVLRGRRLGRFVAGGTSPVAPVGLTSADFDGDGLTDLAGVDAGGRVHLIDNRTPTTNRFLRVTLQGVRNLKRAHGARVEIKAGLSYQKFWYDGLPLTIGVDSHATVDTVRITWPNGLIQNEVQQATGRAVSYEEAQRLSGSCPMIFSWDGRAFRFISDVLGVAPLGASSGDGTYFPLDHDEYVPIPHGALVERNGAYEIRITEELHEVSYLDEVRLVAVDHPADVEVFTNEKFKSPPFPEFRLFGVSHRIHPVAARNETGADVLDRVLSTDRRYPDTFPRDYAGVGALHHLDLDFGKAAPSNRAVLYLEGWVDWADGSSFRAASQVDPQGLILPYLQVKDAQGRWQTVIEDMGIPAGKPKTIAVDLTGKFLSASREVRIVTNLCVYWDEIFLGDSDTPPPAVLTRLTASRATLGFRGFSKVTVDPERKQPETFDYQVVTPVSSWNPTSGLYTRYGDVEPLVPTVDDRFVIMGSGDELRLLFPAAALPALRPGWQRDFLVYVDGWAKDADPNTAFSQTVDPLPFHAMPGYPYQPPLAYPTDPLHEEYRATYNTRPALRLLRPLTIPPIKK